MNKILWALMASCLLALCFRTGAGADPSVDVDSLDPSPNDEGIAVGHRTETDTSQASPQQPQAFRQGAKTFQFQAEVNRLMDIIINSLYSNKDVFLRELISNASDALDKIRLLALKDKEQMGEQPDLKIEIKVDREKRLLSIRDTGVGMTKADLQSNLGTIAKSGTAAFLEQMQKGGDVNLIGQFGVGFYSVYLVADYVEVISKHNDDQQYVWESHGAGRYAISEDAEGAPLGRGTLINIHLKEETQEYADEAKLKELVEKYSEFIDFPIYLWSSKEVESEAPAQDAAEDLEDEDDDEADSDVEDSEDVEDEVDDTEAAASAKSKETVWDWELLNDNKAIWLRNPGDVSEEEYNNFFQALSKGTEAPLAVTHFKAEGDVEFKCVLFVPPSAPMDFMSNYYQEKSALRLYVRRVFISDQFEDITPKYLGFLKGVVDSDTLPLSVSRETLQQHAALKTIKKKIVRKALDMIRKLAEADKAMRTGEADEGAPASQADAAKYATLWKHFGKAIKLGVIEDAQNRQRLAKLLRFETSKSKGEMIGLEEYQARMKEGQKSIYYLAGESVKELQKSPFLEQLLARDYEVIYFTDPVDEYLMQNLQEFEDIKFQNASKDDMKLGGKDTKKENKRLKEAFKDLTAWWKSALTDPSIEGVKISTRLSTTPCVVVTGKYGWTANMERIMKAQALGDAERSSYMKGKRILEINPHHPLIGELKQRFEADQAAPGTAQLASLLYETALLESGFQIDDPKAFNTRIYSLIKDALNLKGDLSMAAAPDEPEDEAEEEEEADDDQQALDEGDDDTPVPERDEL